ncbi:MAG TPA: hypothetical protein VGJ05_05900 [Fimbriiglobus sp.]|jgi:hypothetical protein
MPSLPPFGHRAKNSSSIGTVVFCVVGGIIVLTAVLAVAANESYNDQIGGLGRKPVPHDEQSAKLTDHEIADLKEKKAGIRDFLYGSVCAVMAFVGVGGASMYLRGVRESKRGIYGWVGSQEGARSFGLVGILVPGLALYNLNLADKVDPSFFPGFVMMFGGLPLVSGIVGLHVGRHKEAIGLLAIWTAVGLAVVFCLYADTKDLGRVFSGQGQSPLTTESYVLAAVVLWLVAGTAVFAAGQLIRRYRRKRTYVHNNPHVLDSTMA